MKFIYFLSICLLLTGCGHNVYVESETCGLHIGFPMGVEGSRLSFTIGEAKTVVATVRGGTGFVTETSTGGGLLSGAAGVAKITQFKSNTQLNEGNIEKIMTSPEVPDEVKVKLASQLTENTKAPDFFPTGTSTREAATASNGMTNTLHTFSPTGVDKLVETIPETVKPIVESTEHIIVNVTSNATGVVETVIETAGSTVDNTFNAVVDTTNNIRKTWKSIAIVSGIFCFLCIMFGITKKKQKVTKIVSTIKKIQVPKLVPEPKTKPTKHEGEVSKEMDDLTANASVDDPEFLITEDVPEPEQPKPEKPKKKGFWAKVLLFFGSVFTLWGLLSDDQKDLVSDTFKK